MRLLWYLYYNYAFIPSPKSDFSLSLATNSSTPLFIHYRLPAPAFLRFLPRRGLTGFPPLAPPAFILRALKELRSPELTASPDLAWRFLPPKPYFSFFFWRLGPARSPSLPREKARWALCLLISLSTPTSKRSASVVPRSPDDSWRSGEYC